MTRREPQHGIRRMLVGTAALAVAGATIGVAPASAGGVSAVDITVSTTTDGGPGSLREAVNEVAVNATGGPHTIRLAAGRDVRTHDLR